MAYQYMLAISMRQKICLPVFQIRWKWLDEKCFVIDVRKMQQLRNEMRFFFKKRKEKKENASIIPCWIYYIVWVRKRIIFAYRSVFHWILFKMMIHCEIGRQHRTWKWPMEIMHLFILLFALSTTSYIHTLPLSHSLCFNFINEIHHRHRVTARTYNRFLYTVDHLFRKMCMFMWITRWLLMKIPQKYLLLS